MSFAVPLWDASAIVTLSNSGSLAKFSGELDWVVRTDLNVLVHRLRRDLTGAGLDGSGLVGRARGGHATRFCLAPEAVVEVE